MENFSNYSSTAQSHEAITTSTQSTTTPSGGGTTSSTQAASTRSSSPVSDQQHIVYNPETGQPHVSFDAIPQWALGPRPTEPDWEVIEQLYAEADNPYNPYIDTNVPIVGDVKDAIDGYPVPYHHHRFRLFTLPHYHTTEIPAHNHEAPDHIHDIPALKVKIPPHSHDIVHGIYEDSVLPVSGIRIIIDGKEIGSHTFPLEEFNIIDYLSKDSSGKITRGKHKIQIYPSGNNGALCRIAGELHTQFFVQSRGDYSILNNTS